jgi:diguanylate cyclase (GGDEF)-like protein
MAASDNPPIEPLSSQSDAYLSAGELQDRIEEEIGRAERYGTRLACLLVVIENLEEMEREHGADLAEQTLAYLGGTLRRELRRFDRVGRPGDRELLILLPGADSSQGEMVARRVLDRLSAIKVESDGERKPLQVSLGLAAWSRETDGEALLSRARAATRANNGENGAAPLGPAAPT